MKSIDCRNMACPMPVVTVKRTLEELPPGEELRVLLDEGAPMENVSRFALSRGYSVTELSRNDDEGLIISGSAAQAATPAPGGQNRPSVLFIGSDRLGDGPEDLGRLLMRNFIITLLDVARPPDQILFVNTGILLTTAGSEVIGALTELGNRGVEVMSCGACLDYFHRKDQLEAGSVTNMLTIAESLLSGNVVRL